MLIRTILLTFGLKTKISLSNTYLKITIIITQFFLMIAANLFIAFFANNWRYSILWSRANYYNYHKYFLNNSFECVCCISCKTIDVFRFFELQQILHRNRFWELLETPLGPCIARSWFFCRRRAVSIIYLLTITNSLAEM